MIWGFLKSDQRRSSQQRSWSLEVEHAMFLYFPGPLVVVMARTNNQLEIVSILHVPRNAT